MKVPNDKRKHWASLTLGEEGAVSSYASARIPTARLRHIALLSILRVEWFLLALVFGMMLFLLWPIAQAPSVFPDSGTVLAISRTLASGNFTYVWNTQSPPLQDGLYALIFSLGWPVLSYPPAVASLGLAALLSYFMYRLTGDICGGAIPPLVLLFSEVFWHQAGYLTLYAGFVVLGYAGVFVGVAYVLHGGKWAIAFAGAALLAASLYTYTTALIFLPIPGLALAFYFSAERLRRLTHLYAALFVLTLPWFAWHLSVGGVQYFFYHPYNWFVVKYLDIVNTQFWGHERQAFLPYIRTMWSVGLSEMLAPTLIPLVFVGAWHVWRRLGPRAVAFCLACLALYLLSLLVVRPAPYARYFYPALPLIVLFASVGFWLGLRGIELNVGRRAVLGLLFGASMLPLSGYVPAAVGDAQHKFAGRLDSSPRYSDMTRMAALISTTKGGVISRDSAIQQLIPNNQTYTHFLLREDDYIAYLSWPNDMTVVEMLRRNGIEWALIYKDDKWEKNYNVWLRVAHGLEPRHYVRIATSPYFEKVFDGKVYELYHLQADRKPLVPQPIPDGER